MGDFGLAMMLPFVVERCSWHSMGLCGTGEGVEGLTARAFGFDVLINAFENQFITVGAAYFFHLSLPVSS